MFRGVLLVLGVAALGGCAAPGIEDEALTPVPGIAPGFFFEGGLVRGSFEPDETPRTELLQALHAECPRLRNFRELQSFTPGVVGFTANCR